VTTDDAILLLIGVEAKLIPQAGGGLDLEGPADVLTPELIQELRRHKREILRRMAQAERIDPDCRELRMLLSEAKALVSTPSPPVDPMSATAACQTHRRPP
jgi:hypothetical protein